MPIKEKKITITEIPSLSRLDRFNEFLIKITPNDTKPVIKILKSQGLEVNDSDGVLRVYFTSPYKKYKILEVVKSSINIYTPTTRLIPLFFRAIENAFFLSNVVENLIPRGSQLNISSFGCSVNISKAKAPYNHFFSDISTLIPLAKYELIDDSLKLSKITIKKKDVSINDSLNIIYKQYEKIMSNKKYVFVFITGGYDSRANLALASKYENISGSKIILVRCNFTSSDRFSESESKDHVISKFLAKKCGYDLLNFEVDPNVYEEFKGVLYSDERFIRMNATIARPDTAFNYLVFDYIKSKYKQSVIIAGQTDTHKGSSYRLVKDIEKDYHLLGTVSEGYLKYINRYFGIPYQSGFQIEYVQNVLKRSNIFDLYGQIDYFHYETYNSNLGPSKSIWLHVFDIPFPFLDEEFLETVFNLSSENKIDAFIPKELVRRLSPSLLSTEYNSGGTGAFRKRKRLTDFTIKIFKKIKWITENHFNKRKFYKHLSTAMIEEKQWNSIKPIASNPIIKKLINYCDNYKTDGKNIAVLSTQLTALKLAYIENKLKVKIVFNSKE